jgi:hypothetical protein
VTVLHPDSIKKIENVVTLEETMTVKQALSVIEKIWDIIRACGEQ